MGGRLKSGLAMAGFLAVLAGGPANAQFRAEFSYCDRLQSQYLSAVRQVGGGVSGQSMVQADRIGQQLARAQMAARQGNCDRFVFFGGRRSPQCPAIISDVNRLSRELSQLRRNSFGFFGGYSPQMEAARLRDLLTESGCGVPGTGLARTLCVRVCDGYYFPISSSASRGRLKTDELACQSMYAREGQAELYVQSNSRDVADATSLSGQRYGNQSFAFVYRDNFVPACAAELKAGIAALAERYLALVPAKRKSVVASRIVRPLPLPRAKPPAFEDPETIANLAGSFRVEPVASAAAVAAASGGIRMVGPAYYADLFDLTRERKEPMLRPGFSLISSAAAAEAPEAAPAAAQAPLGAGARDRTLPQ